MNDQAETLRRIVRERNAASPDTGGAAAAPLRKKNPAARCRSIAITSGKGGVGKSNTAISLACALTLFNKKVLILDGDLGLANIHILLGIAPKYNLSHVVSGERPLREILCEGPFGIAIIPGASGLMSMAEIEAVRLEAVIRELNELETRYDFLIIDGGAGIGSVPVRLNLVADSALLIITPEPTSLADAYSVAKLLFAKGAGSIEVLVNMADSDAAGREIFEKLNSLVKTFLNRELVLAGIIPFDKNVTRYIRAQKNIFVEKNASVFAKKIRHTARRICGMRNLTSGGFFARLIADTFEKGTVT